MEIKIKVEEELLEHTVTKGSNADDQIIGMAKMLIPEPKRSNISGVTFNGVTVQFHLKHQGNIRMPS